MYAHTALNQLKLYILIDLFHLHKSGVWRAVGRDEAITAEVLVVVVHRSAEVATICPVVLAALIHRIDTLVHPVPDEATLHVWVSLHYVEELAEVARRVTHGVGKLTHDVWLLCIGALGPSAELGDGWVHRAADVGMGAAKALLELHGAGIVTLVYPLIHLAIYLAIATLVTHRPYDYRGVVLVALDHRLHAVVVCRLPLRTVRGVELGIVALVSHATAMRLDVSLVDKQYAVYVA